MNPFFSLFSPAAGYQMFDPMLGQVQQFSGGSSNDPWSTLNPYAFMLDMMSVGAIDRRIGDLRIIDQWLQLNKFFLQSCIQVLEAQRAAVSSMNTFNPFTQLSGSPMSAGAPASTGANVDSEHSPFWNRSNLPTSRVRSMS
jgi:hypothetical protein